MSVWSIGIYEGASPLTLRPATRIRNPVLTAAAFQGDVDDFVADPFVIHTRDGTYLFVELFSHATAIGRIAVAVSRNLTAWQSLGVVLAEPFHLSYPHVFTDGRTIFMIPETLDAGAVRLYKAAAFPYDWRFVGELVQGRFADPTIFESQGRWWLYCCSTPSKHDEVRLFSSSQVEGPWVEHPRSPIVSGAPDRARPAGRILRWGRRMIRFAQVCTPRYGLNVTALEIKRLTSTEYEEDILAENIFKERAEWNAGRMHHVDAWPTSPDHWFAAVDGRSEGTPPRLSESSET